MGLVHSLACVFFFINNLKTYRLGHLFKVARAATTSVKVANNSNARSIVEAGRKMVVEHHVKGYEEFTKLVEDLETSGEPVHVLFSGGKEENGMSWCPYCTKGKFIDSLEKCESY